MAPKTKKTLAKATSARRKAKPKPKPKIKPDPKPKTLVKREKHPSARSAQSSGTVKKAKKTSQPKQSIKLDTAKKKPDTGKRETLSASPARKAVVQEPSVRRSGGLPLKFLVSVAQAIKDAVAPVASSLKGRDIVSNAPSGDVTFHLDRVAEKTLFAFLKASGLPLSYYSEDEGYSTFTSKPPKNLLIVDPIDGTRAAKSGFEGCVVAVASTRVIERPSVADIDCACVMELLGNRIFMAERGKGARVYVDGHLKRPKLSENTDLEMLTWSMTIPARPAELVFPTAARIIDLSSLKGGFFACNSTSFSLTRMITNQLDACIDIANRYYRDIPNRVEDYFLNAGRGKIIGVAPYDMVAALLIAEEAGCTVTDAYGNRFDQLMVLDSTPANHQSIIAASNKKLHEKLLNFFDTRILQYELLLNRHASR